MPRIEGPATPPLPPQQPVKGSPQVAFPFQQPTPPRHFQGKLLHVATHVMRLQAVAEALQNKDTSRFHFIHFDPETKKARLLTEHFPTTGHIVVIDKQERKLLIDHEFPAEHLNEIIQQAAKQSEELTHFLEELREETAPSNKAIPKQWRPTASIKNTPSSEKEISKEISEQRLETIAQRISAFVESPFHEMLEHNEKVQESEQKTFHAYINLMQLEKQGGNANQAIIGRMDILYIKLEELYRDLT